MLFWWNRILQEKYYHDICIDATNPPIAALFLFRSMANLKANEKRKKET